MKRGVIIGVLFVTLTTVTTAQQFSPIQNRSIVWKCHGWTWIGNASFFCSDIKTHQLSKTGFDGTPILFQSAPTSTPKSVLALAQDATGTVYVVDGVSVYLYSPDGKHQRTLTPGIALSTGIAPLDSEHFYVTGRVPPQIGDSKATIFLVGPNGIEESFSDVFLKGLSGADDMVMNSASYLALDRQRGFLYQVPQNLYEIRVFDLERKAVRTISPPAQYALRTSLQHIGPGSALGPGDSISDIVVLSNGGLAITGDTLDYAEAGEKGTAVSYSRFVDLFDVNGVFAHRLRGTQLKVNGNYLAGFDHSTGRAYFKGDAIVMEAELH